MMKLIRRTLTLIVSIVLLFLLLSFFLPVFGVHLHIWNSGTSMEPNMHWGALNVWVDPGVIPFKDIQVGDIILYRERMRITSASLTIANTKGGERVEADVTGAADETDETGVAGSTDTSEASEYAGKTDRPNEVKYIPGQIAQHRVIAIRGNELYTKGDGNPEPDELSVIESGYVGKTVWYVNYVGRILQMLCNPWVISSLTRLTVLLWILRATASTRSSSCSSSSSSSSTNYSKK